MLYCDKCAKTIGKSRLSIRKRDRCNYCDKKRVCNDDQQKKEVTYESVLRSFADPLMHKLQAPEAIRIDVLTQKYGLCTLQYRQHTGCWHLVLGNEPTNDMISNAVAMASAGKNMRCYTFNTNKNEVIEFLIGGEERSIRPLESSF